MTKKINELDLIILFKSFWKTKYIFLSVILLSISIGSTLHYLSKYSKFEIKLIEKKYLDYKFTQLKERNEIHSKLSIVLSDQNYLDAFLNKHPEFLALKKKSIKNNFNPFFKSSKKINVNFIDSENKLVIFCHDKDVCDIAQIIIDDFLNEIFSDVLDIVKYNLIQEMDEKIKLTQRDLDIAVMLNITNDVKLLEMPNDVFMLLNLLNSENYHKGAKVLKKQMNNMEKEIENIKFNYEDYKKNFDYALFFNRTYLLNLSKVNLKISIFLSILIGFCVSAILSIIINIRNKVLNL